MPVKLEPIQEYIWTCEECGNINIVDEIPENHVTCEKCFYSFDYDLEDGC